MRVKTSITATIVLATFKAEAVVEVGLVVGGAFLLAEEVASKVGEVALTVDSKEEADDSMVDEDRIVDEAHCFEEDVVEGAVGDATK